MIKLTMQGVLKNCNKLIQDNEALFKECDFIVGVSRGGLIPAAFIATKLNKPLVTAYIDKQDNVYIDRLDWLRDKNVVIIDDAIRTGKTMKKIHELVVDATNVNIATIYRHPEASFGGFSNIQKTESIKFPWDINQNNEVVKY